MKNISTDKQNPKKEKARDQFRMVILEEDTLSEVRSFRFSMLGFTLITIATIFAIVCLTFALIAFTPLKYTIPGYAKITNNKVYMDLYNRLTELETELEEQRNYTEGIKNMLNPSGQDNINFSSGIQSAQTQIKHYYFRPPLKGEISATFDIDKSHLGVDIIAPRDTPVKSIMDGVVINADWTVRNGNTISVQHDNDLISIFKHNSALLKSTGDRVLAGEAIAVIGNTGEQSSGPHVHFELWHEGKAINPQDYITFE